MKPIFVVAALLALSTAVADESKTSLAAPGPASNMTNRFAVSGMHCDGCAEGISSELKRAPGVVSADVTFSNKLAVVAYDTNRVSAARLKRVIVEAGYGAKLLKH